MLTLEEKKLQRKAYDKRYNTINGDLKREKRRVNRLRKKAYDELHYQLVRSKRIEKAKDHYYANKPAIMVRRKKKLHSDPHTKLSLYLRNRLNKARAGKYKQGSAVRLLGCSIEQFSKYLESKWKPGMSWQNYGLTGWVVDHIKPLVAFDLTDEEQLVRVCHFTNLQPLWYAENATKGGKYPGEANG